MSGILLSQKSSFFVESFVPGLTKTVLYAEKCFPHYNLHNNYQDKGTSLSREIQTTENPVCVNGFCLAIILLLCLNCHCWKLYTKLMIMYHLKSENERRAASPLHFSLTRLGSLLKRSPSPSYSSANRRVGILFYFNAQCAICLFTRVICFKLQYPSEPRRSVSLSTYAEKDRSKEFEQYSSKSKRLFKALLSMRNPRKDGALYKFLDENWKKEKLEACLVLSFQILVCMYTYNLIYNAMFTNPP